MSLGNPHQYTLELPILLAYLKEESQVWVSANILGVNAVILQIEFWWFFEKHIKKQWKSVKAEKSGVHGFSQFS